MLDRFYLVQPAPCHHPSERSGFFFFEKKCNFSFAVEWTNTYSSTVSLLQKSKLKFQKTNIKIEFAESRVIPSNGQRIQRCGPKNVTETVTSGVNSGSGILWLCFKFICPLDMY